MGTWSKLLGILGALVVVDGAILALGHLGAAVVVPGWKKGPLIDPAAPYAPENAVWLTAVLACVVVDLYVLGLWLWRRVAPRRAWAPFLVLGAAFLCAEGGLRLWLSRTQLTYFRPHPTLHWQVRPNLDGFENRSGGGTLHTNADGLRGVTAARTKSAGTLRLMVLGDSSNFGHGVEGAEMWSTQLEAILEEAGATVEVLNGACPGWTTYQAVEFMRGTGGAYAPDLVIAGFNNDPGPEYFGDAERVMSAPVRALNTVLWRFEGFLLAREVVLSTARRLSPAPEVAYTAREAGTAPTYGALSEAEGRGLVPRVPLPAFLENLRTLQRESEAAGRRFVWIDMPINRAEPELVSRYVNPEYRAAAAALTAELGVPLVGVDERWRRTREADLHIVGHVFHPSAKGHRRLAEQVADMIVGADLVPGVEKAPPVGGPPPATTEATLRLGISSLTPVHAHVLAVLQAQPELAAKHGVVVEPVGYRSGGTQGEHVADGRLDAFFTCEVPAIEMMASRPDARIVASFGALGRVALVAREGATLASLRRVAFAPGSTTEMDWRTWGAGRTVESVPMATDALEAALASGSVDAVVTWDPWAEVMLRTPGRVVLAERAFRSDLAVSVPWSQAEPGRARRLVALVEEALRIAAQDRAKWDAAVSGGSGWPVEVVRAVADQNVWLRGDRAAASSVPEVERTALLRARDFLGRSTLDLAAVIDPALLDGTVSALRYSAETQFNDVARGATPAGASRDPKARPPKGPPPGGPGGPPPGGTPMGKPPPPGGQDHPVGAPVPPPPSGPPPGGPQGPALPPHAPSGPSQTPTAPTPR